MLNTLISLLIATLLILASTGCSDKTPKVEKTDIRCRIDGSLAPEWACTNIPIKGTITAVGSAPLSKLGLGFSKREAMANARSNLAQQIQTLVKTRVKAFSLSSEVGGDEIADNISTEVSKQVAKVTLKGSKQLKFWQNETTKDLYILAGISENDLNKEIKEHIKSSYKEDTSLWKQFQDRQTLDSLDRAFPTD